MSEEMNVQETTGMVINESMKADLLTSAKWAKFLCIIGCIGVAFMVLISVVFLAIGNRFPSPSPFGMMRGVLSSAYLITAAIMIYPLIKGFQFANGTKAACLTNNENELARGFAGMRSYLQFIGILTIIILAIYVQVLIGSRVAIGSMAARF